MELLGKQWKYINEGNAHIVVELINTNYVLRLIKVDGNRIPLESVCQSVDFVNLVMMPLLDINEKNIQEVVCLPEADIVELSKHLSVFRPEHRKTKSILSSYAIKALNLCIVDPHCASSYCLEIKPKEGFMSPIFQEFSKCYYCLKQYLKLKDKLIARSSNYCPLDLFSGDKQRMKKALLDLLENPQNNLKLFKNGNVIYHDQSQRKEFNDIIKNLKLFEDTNQFCDFIISILLGDEKNCEIILIDHRQPTPSKSQKNKKCNNNNFLKDNTFLHKLLKIQKLGMDLSCDRTLAKKTTDDYVPNLINEMKSRLIELPIKNQIQSFLDNLKPIHQLLIAAVAKDCSIMISFTESLFEGVPYVKVGEIKIPYKVSITDLEPKRSNTLIKREATEREMIKIYQNYLADE